LKGNKDQLSGRGYLKGEEQEGQDSRVARKTWDWSRGEWDTGFEAGRRAGFEAERVKHGIGGKDLQRRWVGIFGGKLLNGKSLVSQAL
jgi:hypothetical protein